MCGIEAFLPLRRTGRPPQSRCLRFPARTWRHWSCILLRSQSSLWRSPPGSGDWGPAADPLSWPTGPRGPRPSWRPNRSHRNPEWVKDGRVRGLVWRYNGNIIFWADRMREIMNWREGAHFIPFCSSSLSVLLPFFASCDSNLNIFGLWLR